MTTKCNAWSYTEFWIGVQLMYQMVLEQLVKSKYGLWVIQPYQIKLTFLSFELFTVMEESVLVFGKCDEGVSGEEAEISNPLSKGSGKI